MRTIRARVPRVSVAPVAVDFVGVHATAGEIVGAREEEGFARGVELERLRRARLVGVVGEELEAAGVGRGGVEQDGVVDSELREAAQVDDGQFARRDLVGESASFARLSGAGEREGQAPVAALKIAMPRAAAVFLEQGFVGRAEFAQVGVARAIYFCFLLLIFSVCSRGE